MPSLGSPRVSLDTSFEDTDDDEEGVVPHCSPSSEAVAPPSVVDAASGVCPAEDLLDTCLQGESLMADEDVFSRSQTRKRQNASESEADNTAESPLGDSVRDDPAVMGAAPSDGEPCDLLELSSPSRPVTPTPLKRSRISPSPQRLHGSVW